MKILCKKAGAEYFRFHALRHSGATVMESIGVPIVVNQGLLGHENRKATKIYVHKTGKAALEAIHAFEKATSHTDSHTNKKSTKLSSELSA